MYDRLRHDSDAFLEDLEITNANPDREVCGVQVCDTRGHAMKGGKKEEEREPMGPVL